MTTDEAIRARKTIKVLSDQAFSVPDNNNLIEKTVDELISLASLAPFHYPCHSIHCNNNSLSSIVPWRFYVMFSDSCRKLSSHIIQNKLRGGKITKMLNTTDVMILVTWLPDPDETNRQQFFAASKRNMEHIAATSAAIQNLLLASTSRQIPNYWSSGGILNSQEFFEQFDISQKEILLGAVFLFPQDTGLADLAYGAHRDKRGEQSKYSKTITF